jgi:hypothetical protein
MYHKIKETIDLLIEKLNQLNFTLESNFKKELSVAVPQNKQEQCEQLKKIKISTPSDWDKYQELFELHFPKYYQYIKENYADKTTESEFRMLLILRTTQSYSSISEQLGICKESVRISIYRTRKKLKFKVISELYENLDSIWE